MILFVFNQRNFTLVTYCGSPYLRSLSMNHKKEKRRSNYIKISQRTGKPSSMKIAYFHAIGYLFFPKPTKAAYLQIA